ncbi:hypothetical protein MWU60_18805 [Yoonia sp. F2084L]|uniref:hypothetical protein n=1 Tax=Yoonia sp. F2084L TaxID=2926419 RepID=UPI001FF48AF1|nr:hypothetical protein [Yoonia sp. F2084L]MCK0097631.1 hypothetical protein [Yoonia sp. F2084L]
MTELPNLYFRVRDNGAAVFRINAENRERRIEMDQIAVINTNRGDYKAHGESTLSEHEEAAIKDWLQTRQAVLAARDMDDIHRAMDHLNLTAQWAQSRATDAQLDEVTDQLLMAMHDLRSVLVRKKADRLMKSG